MQRRRDIDGLRAVAIAPVVLFHAGVAGFAGGYVGVDIFFVISGYLIAGILIREGDEQGAPNLIGFYDRRIRRIFPALFAMLAVVTAAALLTFTPSELAHYARSLGATALFVSNILYWRVSDYFSPAAIDSPLLHTWSLAVEEQFYVAMPIALWLAFRFGAARHLRWMLILAALVSLALAEVISHLRPAAAFYLIPTRAWQLLIGAALAAHPGGLPGGRSVRNLAGAAGLLMIVSAVTLFSPETRTPGLAALLPCLGALLVIWAGRDDARCVPARLLAHPAFVGVGLISYSLYLWHWPLLVMPRLFLLRPLSPAETALAIGVSVVVATMPWRWIERPFREGAARPSRLSPQQRSLGAGVLVVLVALATAGLMWRGAPGRLPPAAAQLAAAGGEPAGRACVDLGRSGQQPRCLLDPAPAIGPKVVLWGDSHAAQYGAALQPIVAAQGGELRLATQPACAPLIDATPLTWHGRRDEACAAKTRKILSTIVADPQVRTVVLAGRWSRFFFPANDPESRRLAGGDTESALLASLDRTISRLEAAGLRVVLVGSGPEFLSPLPDCLAKAAWRGLDERRCAFRPQTLPDGEHRRRIKSLLARRPGLVYVDPAVTLCDGGDCRRFVGGSPSHLDADHLSREAAAAVLTQIPSGLLTPPEPKQADTRF